MAFSKKIENDIYKFALLNAISYNGKANVGAVASKMFGIHSELRKKAKDLISKVNTIVKEVNSLTLEQQKEKLSSLGGKIKKKKHVKKTGLHNLSNVKGKIVMRFAPNPNGPPTLGSSRGLIINDEYARKYKGKLIIRFDDTDPLTKKPMLEAYDWYKEDIKWLGIKPNKYIIASDRIKEYYQYAEKLIKLGKAYVCFCTQEEFKKLRHRKKPCPHRESSIKDNLDYWNNMLERKYSDKEAVLRIKTDIKHNDPALRDWVAFRIIREKHPRVEKKYIVWPMLDFESAIEDYLQGITHIIRGIDLIDSEKRQKFIYEYLGWTYPLTMHWGRVAIHGFGKLSTSEMKKAIDSKKYTGWEDPRLPTIRALRQRGFKPEAIRNFWISLGVSKSFVKVSMDSLEAENRKLIDPVANRYFFIQDPIELKIKAKGEVRIPLHPDFPRRGHRTLKINNLILVSEKDLSVLKKGARLMNLASVKLKGRTLESIKTDKQLPVIHWLPKEGNIKTRIITPEAKTLTGLAESNCKKLRKSNIIQFVRFGFCRVDKTKELTFFFTHK